MRESKKSLIGLIFLLAGKGVTAPGADATGTPDIDTEISRRFEKLKVCALSLSLSLCSVLFLSVLSLPHPTSFFKGMLVDLSSGSAKNDLRRGSRADQLRQQSEGGGGLVGRQNKAKGNTKFNMLKYTSIGTAYGEEPDQFQEEEIPPSKVLEFDDLDFGDVIGQGAFSCVYSGKWKDREVAIKKLSFEALEVDDFLIMFKKEVALLSMLNHPNVIDFVGVVTFPSYYMVTQYMHEGALDEILHDPDTPMPWARRVSLLADVARGMHYLHSLVPRVIHRDLKCGNVLVNKDWVAAVTDFGLSVTKSGRMDPADLKFAYNIRMSLENAMTGRHQSYVKPLAAPVGTFPYIAPELLDAKPYNEMVDVYSFSMVLWHVLTRSPPWAGLSDSTFQAKELTETYRPPIPAWCPGPFRQLIEECWDQTTHKRPPFSVILQRLETEISQLPSPNFPPEAQ